ESSPVKTRACVDTRRMAPESISAVDPVAAFRGRRRSHDGIGEARGCGGRPPGPTAGVGRVRPDGGRRWVRGVDRAGQLQPDRRVREAPLLVTLGLGALSASPALLPAHLGLPIAADVLALDPAALGVAAFVTVTVATVRRARR